MATITMNDIIESDRIKREVIRNFKRDLKGKLTLTSEQLDKFEDIFYSVSEGFLFSRKGKKSYGNK